MTVTSFDPSQLIPVGIALGLGLLVGIQRGWAQHDMAEGTRFAGVRTYGLLGLGGGIAGALYAPAPGPALILLAASAGLVVLGYTSQAHFLLNCGIADLLAGASLGERAMAHRLLAEHEMGELFKVIGFAPLHAPFDALGFERGDRSHKL